LNYTSLMQSLDFLYKIWPIFAAIAVICFVYWRTGSMVFVFHRVFQLLGVDNKFSDKEDQRAWDLYEGLNKFNLKTGFRLQSVRSKRNLHDWMRLHNFEISEQRESGRYFRANSLSFDIPNRSRRFGIRSLFFTLIFIFAFVATELNSINCALLQVRATGTWFWVGGGEAFNFQSKLPGALKDDVWKIDQEYCRYPQPEHLSIDSWDEVVVCSLVLGFQEDYIRETVASQKRLATGLLIFVMALMIRLVFLVRAELKARELNGKLTSSDVGDTRLV
jgi:hypothetical protein